MLEQMTALRASLAPTLEIVHSATAGGGGKIDATVAEKKHSRKLRKKNNEPSALTIDAVRQAVLKAGLAFCSIVVHRAVSGESIVARGLHPAPDAPTPEKRRTPAPPVREGK
jgi:hypothetical protein